MRLAVNVPVSERTPKQLSPESWKKAVALGLQLANENKRVSRRLASLRKAQAKQLKMKTRKVSDDETDHAPID